MLLTVRSSFTSFSCINSCPLGYLRFYSLKSVFRLHCLAQLSFLVTVFFVCLAGGGTLSSLVGSFRGSLRGSEDSGVQSSVAPSIEKSANNSALPPRPLSTSVDLSVATATKARSNVLSLESSQMRQTLPQTSAPEAARALDSGDGAKRARIESLLGKLDSLAARAQSIASDGAWVNPVKESKTSDTSSQESFAVAAVRAVDAVVEHGALADADTADDDGESQEASVSTTRSSKEMQGVEMTLVERLSPRPPAASTAGRSASPGATQVLSTRFDPSLAYPSEQDEATAAATRAVLAPSPQQPLPQQKTLYRSSPQSVLPEVEASTPTSNQPKSKSRSEVERALETLAREAEDDFQAAMNSIGGSPPNSSLHATRREREKREAELFLVPEAKQSTPTVTSEAAIAENVATDVMIERFTRWPRQDELNSMGAAARAVLEDAAPGLEVYGGQNSGLLDIVARRVLDRASEAKELEARERWEVQQAIDSARREAREDAAAAAAEAAARREAEEQADLEEEAYAREQEAERAAAAAAAVELARKESAAKAAAEASAGAIEEEEDQRQGNHFGDAEPTELRSSCGAVPGTPPSRQLATPRCEVSPGSLQRQLLAELHLHETLVSSQVQVTKHVLYTLEGCHEVNKAPSTCEKSRRHSLLSGG